MNRRIREDSLDFVRYKPTKCFTVPPLLCKRRLVRDMSNGATEKVCLLLLTNILLGSRRYSRSYTDLKLNNGGLVDSELRCGGASCVVMSAMGFREGVHLFDIAVRSVTCAYTYQPFSASRIACLRKSVLVAPHTLQARVVVFLRLPCALPLSALV